MNSFQAIARIRVERDDYRLPKTYAVREKFSLLLICWDDTEKLFLLSFESGFDDPMNIENENIQNPNSAANRSIGSTTGFHNHGEGPYQGLLLVESAY